MKHLKLFQTQAEFDAETLELPNVSYVVATNSVYYEAPEVIPNNEIWYTSIDGEIALPNAQAIFDKNIISNTYIDGKGIIKFDGDITTIGKRAFLYSNLSSITIPNSVTTIGEGAFGSCRLTSITIPNSVTTIGEGAFSWIDTLTSVIIGDSVTTIGGNAFASCPNLISVTIGNSVTTIEYSAFYYCESLTSITIPNSVTSIGANAFAGCSNLTSVYCKSTTPSAVIGAYEDERTFDENTSDRKIYVPMESVTKYKSANGWSTYASQIIGYDF